MQHSSADTVIVGGGIIGAAIAWHLTQLGAGSVRLLERAGAPAAGSTGRATGGFRAQYGTGINVQLSLLALEQLRAFHDTHGVDPVYMPVGYLFMARSPDTLAVLRDAQRVQHAAGYTDGYEVSTADIARLSPLVDASQFVGGVYAARDGYINPKALLNGLIGSAQRAGVTFSFNTSCSAIEREGDRIVAVHTTNERIATKRVINAAGAWAASVAAMAGVHIPVAPRRRQVAITVPTTLLAPDTPMTIVADNGFHLRVRGDRVLLLQPDEAPVTDPFDTNVDPSWIAAVRRTTNEVIPAMRDVAIDAPSSWAGLYEMSPDRHLIFGATDEIPNLLLANGSSGHGVMHALAIGQLMAELVVDGAAHTLDMSSLAPGRFARGQAIAGPDLL
jgi:sarcosine oxidase subunit beta